MKKHFLLHSNCILVKGINRSTICDLQKRKVELIPNDLCDVLLFLEENSIDDAIAKFGVDNRDTIIEYLTFLETEELGFFLSQEEKSFFPKLDTTFKTPSTISNFILELKTVDKSILEKIIPQLSDLNCQALSIYTESSLTFNDCININNTCNDSTLSSIEIIARYSHEAENFLIKLDKVTNKIIQITLYDSDNESVYKYGDPFLFQLIKTKKIISCKTCGKVSESYMSVNKNKFLESISYNSCLNKKMSIDLDGNIKNCPSMTKSYGNIKEISLKEALSKNDFKNLWTLKKDQIQGCKDCEFRHICTDCRAFIENPKDIYTKPLKCGYNPKTNEWSEWSLNPLKQESIRFYGFG